MLSWRESVPAVRTCAVQGLPPSTNVTCMAPRCFALIPAAGAGIRAGAAVPKQYVPLNGEPMLVHTIRAFVRCPAIATVRVILAPDDAWGDSADAATIRAEAGARLLFDRVGGATRSQSVVNGLRVLASMALADDWVLVHDAARPCISARMIADLVAELADDSIGGLLAVPVPDTLKRADAAGRVATTIARDGVWMAQTPQMFRLGLLNSAYMTAKHVTDEAGAVEAAGFAPRLCVGSARNLKVTYPQDFELASRFLRHPG